MLPFAHQSVNSPEYSGLVPPAISSIFSTAWVAVARRSLGVRPARFHTSTNVVKEGYGGSLSILHWFVNGRTKILCR